jgi:hypothetical protein
MPSAGTAVTAPDFAFLRLKKDLGQFVGTSQYFDLLRC